MSFASKVLYTGDGATTDFNVPMPYISVNHIAVYVNENLHLPVFSYNWTGPSTIQFIDAPGVGDAIFIKRWTSPTDTLVDFVNGSVLNESDLDTAYLHNFYLSQEYSDSFNEAINNVFIQLAGDTGILETETDAIINALTQEMLSLDSAAELQARITDIDANAEAIIELGEGMQLQINTLASGVAASVYIQDEPPVPGVGGIPNPIADGARWYDSNDNNAPYIWVQATLEWVDINDPRIGNNAAAIAVLQTETGDNAAAIVTEQTTRTNADTAIASELHLIGAQNVGETAFIIDLNTAYVGASESLASRFTTMDAVSSGNAADIITEAGVAADASGAVAFDVSLIGASNGADTAFILDSSTVKVDSDGGDTMATKFTAIGTNAASIVTHQTILDEHEAEYGVDITSNGYVSGFRLFNNGTPGESAFVILADKFAIVDPSGDPGETEFIPMQIVGGKVRFNTNVEIDGDLMVSGTINGSAIVPGGIGTTQIGPNAIYSTQIAANEVKAANIEALAITADKINVTNLEAVSTATGDLSVDGDLTMATTSAILGGQTAFNTGDGYFLGYSGSDYKFSIGDGADNRLTWDGTDLTVSGIIKVGVYVASDTILASANTARADTGLIYNGSYRYATYKTFTSDKDGVMRLKWKLKKNTTSTSAPYTNAACRVTLNGSLLGTYFSSSTAYADYERDITVSEGDVIDIDLAKGTYWGAGAEPWPVILTVDNASFNADIQFTGSPTVNLN